MMHNIAFNFAVLKFIVNIVFYIRSPVLIYPSEDHFTSFHELIILSFPAFQDIVTEQQVILNSDFRAHLFL